jgi:hypothetical protein
VKLLSTEGFGLDLDVTGYQYPELADPDDGNWLRVVGRVEHPRGGWRFDDPCLTTSELVQLAGWFDGVANGAPDPDAGSFIEPNLAFSWTAAPQPLIHVTLAYESAPRWLTDREARMDGVTLHFPVSMNDPSALSAALREMLLRFPVRGHEGGAV